MKYQTLDEQLKEFPVYCVINGKLILTTIKSIYDYSHYLFEIHHYIREQMYYRNQMKYLSKQKLILLNKKMHADLHSAMSDERFYERYGIERNKLIYRRRII